MRRTLCVCLVSILAAACTRETLQPLPLQVGLEASRTTAAPGDTIIFVVTAQGGALIGVQTDYGDTSGDQFATSGARTARVTFLHAYQLRGTFTVKATVTDALSPNQQSATVEVRVQ